MEISNIPLTVGRWMDYSLVQKSDIEALARLENIPVKILKESLNPEHLPKFEVHPEFSFAILRVYDPKKKATADTVQELTTKIVMFLSPDKLITLHRIDISFFDQLKKDVKSSAQPTNAMLVLKDLFYHSIKSFENPLNELTIKSESFEENIFKLKRKNHILRDGYYLKRKSSSFRKILKLTGDTLNKIVSRNEFQAAQFHEYRDLIEKFQFYAEDNLENVTALLNLHLSLSSHQTNEASYRTNEIVRILTVFSIFFLPLNFIAGVYGMNFDHMPELKNPYGYWSILGVMVLVSMSLFVWMFKRGWIRGIDENPDAK